MDATSTDLPQRGGAAPAPEAHGADASHDHGDGIYIRVAVILGVLTAMEVTTYTHESTWGDLAIPAILIMMTIKFVLVVMFFMHLKDDPKLLATVFSFGLGLAVAVYLMTLMASQHFG
jgi:cytochrome c oxidase subunit 4